MAKKAVPPEQWLPVIPAGFEDYTLDDLQRLMEEREDEGEIVASVESEDSNE